jgi:hypothetical protein
MNDSRSGATLVEVLVAIFVMGIGLLTLMALFPLGILSMAQAIKDDRCGHAAADALGCDQAWDFRHGSPYCEATTGTQALHMGPYYDTTQATGAVYWAKDPKNTSNTALGNGLVPASMTAISSGNPGYPLYFDPVGIKGGYDMMLGHTVGTPLPSGVLAPPGIQRVQFQPDTAITGWPPAPAAGAAHPIITQLVNSLDWRIRWFTLLDDIEFENNGVPAPGVLTGGNNTAREDRYTWAYMLRMPDVGAPNFVETSIVVYSGRPQLPTETTFVAKWQGNVVTLNRAAGTPAPAIRKGAWILDGTVITTAGKVTPNGYFYRVTAVNEGVSGPNTTDLELQSTRRGPVNDPDPAVQNSGFVVVMEGVVEVFERLATQPVFNTTGFNPTDLRSTNAPW